MKPTDTRIRTCLLSLAIATLAAPIAHAGVLALPQAAEQPAKADPNRAFAQALADAARKHHGRHRATHRATRMKVRKIEPDVAKPQPVPSPLATRSPNRVAPGASRQAEAREAAAREARADYLYRASQTSAPIIANATACKRIGAHGESIYENCGAANAAGAAGSR